MCAPYHHCAYAYVVSRNCTAPILSNFKFFKELQQCQSRHHARWKLLYCRERAGLAWLVEWGKMPPDVWVGSPGVVCCHELEFSGTGTPITDYTELYSYLPPATNYTFRRVTHISTLFFLRHLLGFQVKPNKERYYSCTPV